MTGPPTTLKASLHRLKKGFGISARDNQGVASSRNTGIAQAQGEYVALLDGDDLWEPRKLAAQIEAAYRFPKSGIIVANGVEFDESGILQPSLLRDVQRVLRLQEDQVVTVPYYDQALEWNPIWTVSQVMIPRAVLQHIGVSDSTFTCGSDYDLYLRIAEKYDLTFIMERLVRWRYLTTSASGRREIRALRYRLDHILALKKQTRTTSSLDGRSLRTSWIDGSRLQVNPHTTMGRQHDLCCTRML